MNGKSLPHTESTAGPSEEAGPARTPAWSVHEPSPLPRGTTGGFPRGTLTSPGPSLVESVDFLDSGLRRRATLPLPHCRRERAGVREPISLKRQLCAHAAVLIRTPHPFPLPAKMRGEGTFFAPARETGNIRRRSTVLVRRLHLSQRASRSVPAVSDDYQTRTSR
jgi:hypothetical protein